MPRTAFVNNGMSVVGQTDTACGGINFTVAETQARHVARERVNVS